MRPPLPIIALALLLLLPGLFSSGCDGGTARIAKETAVTRNLALATRDLLDSTANDTVNIQHNISAILAEDPPPPIVSRLALVEESVGDIAEKISAARSYQESILASQDKVVNTLPSVVDRESSWLRALKLIALIVAPLALFGLLWYTGAGLLLRRIFWSIGLFLPRSTDISAKFDAEAVEEGTASSARREAVAARRAADPAFDVAYKKHQTRIRASSPRPTPKD